MYSDSEGFIKVCFSAEFPSRLRWGGSIEVPPDRVFALDGRIDAWFSGPWPFEARDYLRPSEHSRLAHVAFGAPRKVQLRASRLGCHFDPDDYPAPLSEPAA